MKTKYNLMVAPNGARLTKADHPALPITASEVVETAYNCALAGANAIHVHVRDDDGSHSIDPNRYKTVISQLQARVKMNIQVSTESVGLFDVAEQLDCLEKVPTSDASVSLREIARDPALFAKTYATADRRGIDIQHILYSAKEVTELLAHFDRGEIPEQSRRAIFVLGRYAENQRSVPNDLEPFLKQLKGDHLDWSVCAFGPKEQDCLLAALNSGGHVRIGFENNRVSPDGSVFPNNAASVASFVKAAYRIGFKPNGPMP